MTGTAVSRAMTSRFAAAQQVADAVLLEGYALYPYRASAPKNRERWQFGVLVPPGYRATDEPSEQRTECLLAAREGARAHVRVRFLQLQQRESRRPASEGPRLWDEGVERLLDLEVSVSELLETPVEQRFTMPGGRDDDPRAGTTRRTWPIEGSVSVRGTLLDETRGLVRLRIEVRNTSRWRGRTSTRRAIALRRSMIATHALIAAGGGGFLSLLDPPAWAQAAAVGCENRHAFPVLAGEEGASDVVLSSPIILYDHPRIAPESAGDLFDATEIDELLTLRTLTLTEDEKREVRATDARTSALLARVEDAPGEALQRLHGAIRGSRDVGARGDDRVEVAGVTVRRGSRVLLRPGARRADAHDMFLRGRVGIVEGVYHDLEGGVQVAVTLPDDPAADLHRWYGRYLYFALDEIEPLGGDR